MAIPDGFRTLTPYLVVDGAEKAIELYKAAFGAEQVSVSRTPHGAIMNAQLRIGDSMLMLNDEFPDYGVLGPKKVGGTAVSLHMYVEDAQAVWDRAVAAGLTVTMPLEKQFWGDIFGQLSDEFGHSWSIASRVEEVDAEEMALREKAFGDTE